MIEARIDGREKAPWLRCRGCKKVYFAGYKHCSGCHDTFEAEFKDWHLIDGQCVPPKRFKMKLDGDVWRS